MKITGIQADNIFAIKRIDIKIHTPIVLFCGRNGSMKSSIYDTVAMAITQRNARGVVHKKDFGLLVHDGEKQGGALIQIDNDIERAFGFHMPNGKFSGEPISDSMRVSLEGQRFGKMKPDERRAFLFELTKTKATPEFVKTRMLDKRYGCDAAKVEEILIPLRDGFQSACDYAKAEATKSKGSWRQLTGETYGPVAAPKWRATKPDVPKGDPSQLEAMVAELDTSISMATEQLGDVKANAVAAIDNASRRANLEASAKKLPELEDQHKNAQAELAEYLPKVEALRVAASGKARVGLVHDMAKFIQECVYHEISSEAENLLALYEAEYGSIDAKIDTAAQASLPEHEKGLTVIQNRVTNLQRDIDSAKMAKGQLDALGVILKHKASDELISRLNESIAKKKASRQEVELQRLDILAAIKNREEADTKTKAALGHHKNVEEWLYVAEALAPSGIPAELLKSAMEPVNRALEQASLDTTWPQVVIDEDMTITVGKRLYQMESESYQWRADAMIAQVVAELSGLKIMMLDRVDVLDMLARTQLFEWLDMLTAEGLLDTALLFARLNEYPRGLLDTFTAYWVEGGMIADQPQQVAA